MALFPRSMRLIRQNLQLLIYTHRFTTCSCNCLRLSPLFHHHTKRIYSTQNSSPGYKAMMGQDLEEEPINNYTPDYGLALDSWQFDVGSSGLLKLKSPMSVHIEALDPQKFPDVNKVYLNMLFLGKEALSGQQMIDMAKNYTVSADLDEDSVNLHLNIDYKKDFQEMPNMQCHLQIPVKYDIDVTCTGESDVSVIMLENEIVTVNTQLGDCSLNSLKSVKVTINTQGGDIESKSAVQGNISMKTGSDGSIETGRLQGQTIECQTEKGHMKVKAIYGENSRFKTSSGKLDLSNCHGATEIDSDQGNVSIGTMDGDLTASVTKGDISVFFAREGIHSISSQSGNIILKMPSLNSNLDLSGKIIDEGDVKIYRKDETVEENLSKLKGCLTAKTDNVGSIKAITQEGRIELQSHSWLSTLNLSNNHD